MASGAYQNTPFTVIHHEQQPILTTLQKHLSIPKSPNRTNFPYQLEQPDPNSASELDSKTRRKDNYFPIQDSIYNIGEQPAVVVGQQQQQQKAKILNKPGDAISAKLPIVTERPAIAIAYTPSTRRPQTAQQQGGYINHYSMPNYDSAVIPEILDNFQAAAPFKRDELDVAYPLPAAGGGGGSVSDYYEKDFQAPFHPSVNLGTISDSYQGWAILDRTTKRTNQVENPLPPSPPQQQLFLQQKNSGVTNEIDRKDKNRDELIIGDYTSEAKDPIAQDGNGFHPELEGGFMPIVPAHLMDVDHHEMAMKLDEDIPVAQKQVAARPQEIVMGKDTMVDISAEVSQEEKPQQVQAVKIEEEPMSVMNVHSASMVVGNNEDVEEDEDDTEQEAQPQRMQEPERKPNIMPVDSVVEGSTEKVMSLGDALSAIFGLDDEKFDEMTTKSQFNEIDMTSRSS